MQVDRTVPAGTLQTKRLRAEQVFPGITYEEAKWSRDEHDRITGTGQYARIGPLPQQ